MRLKVINRLVPLAATAAFLLLSGRALAAFALPPVTKSDHIRGNANARITMIEYTDFECPFCKRHFPIMQTLMKRYSGKVNWVYRPFPLMFHPLAMPAAEAAECVAELKGERAFWRFHDLLFRKGRARDAESTGRYLITEAHLPQIAASLGVRRDAFTVCMDSDRQLAKVEASIAAGTSAGVNGTPATFLRDNRTGDFELVPGALPLAIFTEKIDTMLKQ